MCVLWENNSHQQGVLLVLCKKNDLIVGDLICMFCIHIIQYYIGWEFWNYILPWCLHGWPTQVSKYICSHFFYWRRWWDKNLINQCKWNEHHLWKWNFWEGAWMWWDQNLVYMFPLFNWLYLRQRWIVHGKDLLFVAKNMCRCEGRLVYCSLVIGLDE